MNGNRKSKNRLAWVAYIAVGGWDNTLNNSYSAVRFQLLVVQNWYLDSISNNLINYIMFEVIPKKMFWSIMNPVLLFRRITLKVPEVFASFF